MRKSFKNACKIDEFGLLGPARSLLEALLGRLGDLLGRVDAIFGRLWAISGRLGVFLGHLGGLGGLLRSSRKLCGTDP